MYAYQNIDNQCFNNKNYLLIDFDCNVKMKNLKSKSKNLWKVENNKLRGNLLFIKKLSIKYAHLPNKIFKLHFAINKSIGGNEYNMLHTFFIVL